MADIETLVVPGGLLKYSDRSEDRSRSENTANQEIPRTIHQIFLPFKEGATVDDYPVFVRNIAKTREFCETHKIKHEMWGEEETNRLIHQLGPQFVKIYYSERFTQQKILRVDFVRYCILYMYGGIYVDSDVHPIRSLTRLFKMPYFFVTWADDKEQKPYNAVIGTFKRNPIYMTILKESYRSFYEKIQIPAYQKWRGRFVFQTTGHHMLKRALKDLKTTNILNDVMYQPPNKEKDRGAVGDPTTALFEDANASVWFGGSGE